MGGSGVEAGFADGAEGPGSAAVDAGRVWCMSAGESHRALADRLRESVLGSGTGPQRMREGALAAGAGEACDLPPEEEALARLVGEASYRVTDEQVAAVRASRGSEVAAFELIMSASIGAGLRRWDAAARVIEEASDASS